MGRVDGGLAGPAVGGRLAHKWRLVRVIGSGGAATVYEAEHQNLSRVAIKVMHASAAGSPAQCRRFLLEGYAANRVNHPGTVRVFDDGEDDSGRPFLVMELLEGETVAERARREGGRLHADDVVELACQLLDILCAAHKSGTLHRDIKPENLFVTKDRRLKVLDFGIARMMDEQLGEAATAHGTLLGTPAYLAPEQALGQWDAVDERTDLWAVGATMFQLLTGRFVHEGRTPNEQLALAMTRPAPSLAEINPDVPEHIARVVDRALSFSREDRFPTAAAMLDALGGQGSASRAELARPCAHDSMPVAEQTLVDDQAGPARTRPPLAAAAAITALVALAAGGALLPGRASGTVTASKSAGPTATGVAQPVKTTAEPPSAAERHHGVTAEPLNAAETIDAGQHAATTTPPITRDATELAEKVSVGAVPRATAEMESAGPGCDVLDSRY